jgi:hypothetical protein
VSRDGFDDLTFIIERKGNAWTWGNLLLWPIGDIVDGVTGAAVSFEPAEVHANLVPLPAAIRSDPPRGGSDGVAAAAEGLEQR